MYEMYGGASAHREGYGHGTAALWPRWLQPASKDFTVSVITTGLELQGRGTLHV